MKLATVFFLSILAFGYADEPVVVHSATRVTVGGKEYGKPIDAIANNRQLAPEIQRALEAWAASVEATRDDATAELAALKSRIDSTLNSLLTEELKTGEGPKTLLLRKLIAEAQKTEKQIKLESLKAEIAAKEKEAADLQK